MSDTLYLSLWYPNLRLATLAEKLASVLGEFARNGGEPLVYSATVWPVSWQEAPVFQRVYGRAVQAAGAEGAVQLGAEPKAAVEDALELLHEDFAYEFQIGWSLWELEVVAVEAALRATPGPSTSPLAKSASGFAQEDNLKIGIRRTHEGNSVEEVLSRRASGSAQDDNSAGGLRAASGLEPRWVRTPRLVRVTGFGPLFDDGVYEHDGHIRVDFGSDTPFLEEEAELDSIGARLMAENVRRLVDLANAVDKASGATARLLWSELGESLAQRLAARLSKGN